MRDAFVLGASSLFFSNKNPAKNRRVAMYYLVAMSYYCLLERQGKACLEARLSKAL